MQSKILISSNLKISVIGLGYIGLPLAIEQYQQGVILSAPDARGNYIDSVSIKNYMDLFLFLPTAFIKYLFEPLISFNQISSLKDIIAIVENILRLLLILLCLLISLLVETKKIEAPLK